MIWFSSDHHFFHQNVLGFCNRPFASLDEMHAALIENWNQCVGPADTIYVLGDFSYRNKSGEVEAIFAQLHGHKHLIRGNHDGKHVLHLPWESQADYKDIKIDRRHYVLSHYAFIEWNRSHHGSVHLHGHHHGTLQSSHPRRLDVGVDTHQYRPISFEQIREMIRENEQQQSALGEDQ
jgi:calcineurin-like phosphoesterase family protein